MRSARSARLPLLSRARPVLDDCLLEVLVLLARDEADPLEGGEMLLSLRQIVDDEVRLTDVLVSTAMAGIELQGALIMHEGRLQIAALAVRVTEVVLDVGVACVAKRSRGKRPDRSAPVLRCDGRLPGRVLRVDLLLRRLLGRIRENPGWLQGQAEAEQTDENPRADHIIGCWPAAVSPREVRVGR